MHQWYYIDWFSVERIFWSFPFIFRHRLRSLIMHTAVNWDTCYIFAKFPSLQKKRLQNSNSLWKIVWVFLLFVEVQLTESKKFLRLLVDNLPCRLCVIKKCCVDNMSVYTMPFLINTKCWEKVHTHVIWQLWIR
jgi:hypothetical protein